MDQQTHTYSIQTDTAFADNTVPALRQGHPEQVFQKRGEVKQSDKSPSGHQESGICIKAAPEGCEPMQ